MTPILYSFRRCPYAMRARLALAVSGVDVELRVELREVDLRNRPDALREASHKATVPVVVLGDGRVIDESLDLMRWALEQADPEEWLPSEDGARAETDRLIAANDGEFKADLDRFKYPDRHDNADPLAARQRAEGHLRDLEARLGRGRNLLGESLAMVDIALFPFVRQFARTDAAWFEGSDFAGIRRWLLEREADPLFRRIMRKVPTWHAGDPPLRFSDAYPESRA